MRMKQHSSSSASARTSRSSSRTHCASASSPRPRGSLRGRRRGVTVAAARAHSFPKLLPLLRRHLFPPLEHPPAVVPPRPASKSAEEDLREDQKAEGLPVRERVPVGGRRNHAVP